MTPPARAGHRSWIGAGAGATVLVLTLVGLHVLGGRDLAAPPITSIDAWSRWAQQRDAATLALVAVRLGALVVGYLLILTSALTVIGRLLDRPRLVHLAEAATPAAFRGTVRRLAGLGLSATAALASPLAGAAADPAPGTATLAVTEAPIGETAGTATLERVEAQEPAAEAKDARPPAAEPGTTEPGTIEPGRAEPGPATVRPTDPRPGPTEAPVRHRPPVAPEPPARPAPPAEPVRADVGRHVAGAGDHLWSIAEDRLTAAWGRPPTDHEIDRYWRAVVAANPAIGDPDLLFVGHVVLVPPPPVTPT